MSAIRIYVAVTPDQLNLLFSCEAQDQLRQLGVVDFSTETDQVELPQDLADSYDVVVTSWATRRGEPERFLGTRLKLIVHAAASIKALIPRDVLKHGVRVTQCGAAPMARAVAEAAVTVTLVMLRHIHLYDRQIQSSKDWTASRAPALGRAIHSRAIGIIGLSRVGVHYARMIRGVGATTIRAYDPYFDVEEAHALGIELVGLDQVFQTCDVVTLHAPVTPETHHMVGRDQLALLADDAILVNTARSALVDNDALLAEVTFGRIHAALDVFDNEPLPSSSGYLGLDNVLVTPHIAGATLEARFEQGDTVIAELKQFISEKELQHEVTLDAYDRLA